MRIGLDFDNTIACYDGVFHAAAVERGLVPAELPTDKTSVRNHLRAIGREDDWTELQGYVYGARMDLVSPYPGVADFIAAAQRAGHELYIVSHKTRTPFRGPAYDLHEAARGFLAAHGLTDRIPEDHAYFELTLAQKLARISALQLDAFVDDLPELLAEPALPATCRAILFDPDGHAPDGVWKGRRFERHADWRGIEAALLGRAAA
jgi:FMN phosphatase YigB (HAD superfamily)